MDTQDKQAALVIAAGAAATAYPLACLYRKQARWILRQRTPVLCLVAMVAVAANAGISYLTVKQAQTGPRR